MGGGKNIQEQMDQAFRRKLERLLPKQSIIGKVLTVDRANMTCEVEPADGGAAYNDVRLQAIIDDNDQGVVLFPKEGSFVMVSLVENNENNNYVSQYTEIDEFVYKIDELEFSGNTEGVRVNNKGENLKTVLNDFQKEFGKLCDAVAAIVVSVGVTPNVPLINQIKEAVTNANLTRLNKILK